MIKNLSSYHQVKYKVPSDVGNCHSDIHPGDVRFGIVNYYDEETKKEWEMGNIIVEDAVLPISFIVPNDKNIAIASKDLKDPNDWFSNEYYIFIKNEYKKALKNEESNLNKFVPGRIFMAGCAESCAYYIVTKVNKKTCHVEWRGFNPDRDFDRILGAGGKFPRLTIEDMVRTSNRHK